MQLSWRLPNKSVKAIYLTFWLPEPCHAQLDAMVRTARRYAESA